MLKTLDKLEGVHNYYGRKIIQVTDETGSHTASAICYSRKVENIDQRIFDLEMIDDFDGPKVNYVPTWERDPNWRNNYSLF